MKTNQLYKIVELRNSGYKVRWITRNLKEGEKMYSRLAEIKPNGKFILYDNDKIILENDDINSEYSNFSDSEEEINVRKYNSDTNYESDTSSELSLNTDSKESIEKLESIKRENLKKNIENLKRNIYCDSLVINIIIMTMMVLFGILIQLTNKIHF